MFVAVVTLHLTNEYSKCFYSSVLEEDISLSNIHFDYLFLFK